MDSKKWPVVLYLKQIVVFDLKFCTWKFGVAFTNSTVTNSKPSETRQILMVWRNNVAKITLPNWEKKECCRNSSFWNSVAIFEGLTKVNRVFWKTALKWYIYVKDILNYLKINKKIPYLLRKVLKLKLFNFRFLRHYSFFFLSTLFSFLHFDIIIATHFNLDLY